MNTNVYMAALPRSGTTLLGMMLNQHSDCLYVGESCFWPNFVPGKSKCSCGMIDCPTLMNIWRQINNVPSIMMMADIFKILDNLPELDVKTYSDRFCEDGQLYYWHEASFVSEI